MEKPRIIRLGDNTSIENVTFEDAFGEFSEVRGRGRARRHKRKMERQENRAKRKAAKRKHRQERLEDRIQRRRTRRAFRAEKRGAGNEPENEMDVKTSTEMQDGQAPQAPQTPQPEQGGQAEQGGQGGVPSDQPSGINNQGEGQGEAVSSEPAIVREAESQEQEGGSDESATSEDSGSEPVDSDGGEDTESDSGDSGFDGEGSISEDSYGSGIKGAEDYYSYADGRGIRRRARIHPKVKDVAHRSAWNKELVSRMKSKLGTTKNPKQIAAIKSRIEKHEQRANELDGQLNQYASDENNGQKRSAEVQAANKLALRARMATRPTVSNGGDVTPVDAELNPEFGKNRIVIPEEGSSFNGVGTGLIGLSDSKDYDAPPVRTVELKSGVDGKTTASKINWKYVLIGVGVAAIGIYAYKKYGKGK